ncbi:hypothetical protein D9756_005146 [Leucocoprinus leucothites]|uniref:Uncharacterized protein n=1 Tax=Leucocoprinus leucothites TaxID=201217 RepID=A0A8H5G9Z9_9AGAR|nr:hypothetical protein D9756_005146 [Leucoagaricus leucothites]
MVAALQAFITVGISTTSAAIASPYPTLSLGCWIAADIPGPFGKFAYFGTFPISYAALLHHQALTFMICFAA